MPPRTWPHAPLDAVELAELVVQQVVRGARRARAGPHADHAGRGVGALERVVLEPVVEQVADRHRHDAEAARGCSRCRSPAARPASRSSSSTSPGCARAERGRRAQHHRAQEVGHRARAAPRSRHRVGVLARDARERGVRGRRVVVEEDRRAVGGERGERRVERDRVVAEAAAARGRRRPSAAASRRRRRRARRAGPGHTSSVTQAPPRMSRRSSTQTRRPARAR